MPGTLYVGDVHLSPRKVDEYRWEIFSWLRHQCDRRNVERVVFLGDLVDRKDEHPSAFVNRTIEELFSLPEVWYLIGNHDYIDPEVPFFRFLDGLANVHVVWEPAEATFDGQRHLLLPHAEMPETAWSDIDFEPYDYILMHQSVRGARASNGQKMRGLRLRRFHGTNARVISGDIHVPQVLGPVTYVGSPHPVHIGDDHEPRVLFNDGNKLRSIPRHHLKKLKVVIHDAEELDVALREKNLEPPDHVQVSLEVLPGTARDVSKDRRTIRAKLLKAGYVVHGVSIDVVEPPKRRKTLKPKSALRQTPSQDLATFIDEEHSFTDRSWKECGLRIAEQFDAKVETRNPGDVVLDHITLQGFRSFVLPKRLNFWSRRPGLYLMTGQNTVDEGMTTNGVGKSSTFSGLSFAFFDKDPRGLKGPALHNWNRVEPCIVEVGFKKRKVSHILRRGHDPNFLCWIDKRDDEHKATTEDVTDLLGTTYEHFLCTVLQGQFGVTFFDLTENQQQQVLASALNLDIWTEASKIAAREQKEHYEQSLKLRDLVQTETGRIRELKERANALVSDIERSDAEARARAKELEANLSVIRKGIRKTTRLFNAAEKEIKKLRKTLGEFRNDHYELTKSARSLRSELRRSEKEQSRLLAELDHLEHRREVLTLDRCDRCSQTIDENARTDFEEKLEIERRAYQDELDAVSETVREQRSALDQSEVEAQTLEEKVRGTERRIESRRLERDRADRERNKLIADRERTEADIREIESFHSILQKNLVATRKRLSESRENRRTFRKRRKAVEQSRSEAKSWVETFKSARLWFLERATWELEVEVNNAIQELGLGGWEIRFSSQREGSKGKPVYGFTTEVKSPTSVGWVPWKAWCGGETQRLRIAGAVGLSKLIEGRTGIRWNVEFWDEPTQHLDASGFSDMLAYFRKRAYEEKRQVWVVDHHSINLSGFDGHVIVKKDRGGSRFVAKTYNLDGE